MGTHHARVPRVQRVRSFTFKEKGGLAPRVSSHVTVALVKISGIIGIGERRNDHQLSSRLRIIKVVISPRDLVFSRSGM